MPQHDGMRRRPIELLALFALACSSKPPRPGTEVVRPDESGGASSAGGSTSLEPVPDPLFNSGGAGGSTARQQNLISLRIEPTDALLDVPRGQSRQLSYRALGRLEDDPDNEVDITARTVFYVPDRYLVAGFPPDGSSTLHTQLPSNGEFAQSGGRFTVQAQ